MDFTEVLEHELVNTTPFLFITLIVGQETVSIFKSLGEKGAKYSEAQNILDLLF